MAKLSRTFNVLTILTFLYEVQGKLEIRFSLPVVESNKADQYLCFARKLDEFDDINVDGIELHVDKENAHHVSLSVCKAPSSDQHVWDCAAAQGKVCQGNAVNLGGWEARNKHSGKYNLPKGLSVRVGKYTPMQYIVTQVHFKHSIRNATSAIANITVQLNTDRSTLNYQTYSFINEGYIPKLKKKGFFAESACQWSKPPVLLYTFTTHTHGHGVLVEGFLVRNGTWTVLGSQLKNGEEKHFQNVPGGPVSIQPGDILAARCLYINNKPRPIKFGMADEDEMCNFSLTFGYEDRYTDDFIRPIGCLSESPRFRFCNSSRMNSFC
ncbi:probable peptidylglycine alpha-hydroxylating monooxygenase 1 [Saccostrea cucullata]|uniref:probable peptidylglycine alpha-hydroxylating monooxygenase 1 n=1 Tax=Saccostrea cuccullata TaxID=36930 RepID=UPI002ED19254